MFVGFAKTLKSMGGFRIGFRITKRNALYGLFLMLFIGMFYLMWYMLIAAGWGLYWMMYGIYKLYYFMFKGAAIGGKKAYSAIKENVRPDQTEGGEYE